MEIFKIRYKSTNCYFIDTNNGILGFDAGWPDTYKLYKDLIKVEGFHIKDIKWLMVSHFHMDHAGLAGVLSHQGVQLVIFRNQLNAIDEMEDLIEKKGIKYTPIDLRKAIILDLSESRIWLNSIGITGEVIKTNSHGEQSITLLLDSGEAFIGDLVPNADMTADDDLLSKSNWDELKSKGAKKIKPAHSEEYDL